MRWFAVVVAALVVVVVVDARASSSSSSSSSTTTSSTTTTTTFSLGESTAAREMKRSFDADVAGVRRRYRRRLRATRHTFAKRFLQGLADAVMPTKQFAEAGKHLNTLVAGVGGVADSVVPGSGDAIKGVHAAANGVATGVSGAFTGVAKEAAPFVVDAFVPGAGQFAKPFTDNALDGVKEMHASANADLATNPEYANVRDMHALGNQVGSVAHVARDAIPLSDQQVAAAGKIYSMASGGGAGQGMGDLANPDWAKFGEGMKGYGLEQAGMPGLGGASNPLAATAGGAGANVAGGAGALPGVVSVPAGGANTGVAGWSPQMLMAHGATTPATATATTAPAPGANGAMSPQLMHSLLTARQHSGAVGTPGATGAPPDPAFANVAHVARSGVSGGGGGGGGGGFTPEQVAQITGIMSAINTPNSANPYAAHRLAKRSLDDSYVVLSHRSMRMMKRALRARASAALHRVHVDARNELAGVVRRYRKRAFELEQQQQQQQDDDDNDESMALSMA